MYSETLLRGGGEWLLGIYHGVSLIVARVLDHSSPYKIAKLNGAVMFMTEDLLTARSYILYFDFFLLSWLSHIKVIII